MEYSDPVTARTLMDSALGVGSKPDLSPVQLTTLFELAKIEGQELWSDASLSAAVATGWRWKAALLANQYKLAAGGATLDRNQWFEQCMQLAKLYTTGEWAVGASEGTTVESEELTLADEPFYFFADVLSQGKGQEW